MTADLIAEVCKALTALLKMACPPDEERYIDEFIAAEKMAQAALAKLRAAQGEGGHGPVDGDALARWLTTDDPPSPSSASDEALVKAYRAGVYFGDSVAPMEKWNDEDAIESAAREWVRKERGE